MSSKRLEKVCSERKFPARDKLEIVCSERKFPERDKLEIVCSERKCPERDKLEIVCSERNFPKEMIGKEGILFRNLPVIAVMDFRFKSIPIRFT